MRRDHAALVGVSLAVWAGRGGDHGYTSRAELDRRIAPIGTRRFGTRIMSAGPRNHNAAPAGGWTERLDALDQNGRATGFQRSHAQTDAEEIGIEEIVGASPTALASFSGTAASAPVSGAVTRASTLGATSNTPL